MAVPTVLRHGPFRFYFYSGDGGEPRHVHVEDGSSEAKYWLDPVTQAYNHGFNRKDLSRIERIIVDNLDQLRGAWDDFFNP
jgi:hypothetical protein